MTERSKSLLKLFGFLSFACLISWMALMYNERKQTEIRSSEKAKIERVKIKPKYELELLNWSWSIIASGTFVEAKGEVKNISGQSLRNVVAMATFYDQNGNFITADEALIDFNPILTNQKSPFSVLETYNPAMRGATIQFKFLFGGTIPTKQ